ncbi:MAG: DUF3368 domain-containing protein [candidate division Zixibacteria bacterium]|nr:DUF3368 domain-containing protein [candidate division Zixibacteria bacterium]
MMVVSNTAPLIGLAAIKRFDLLYHLFGRIHIPTAVYAETVSSGHEEGGAKQEVSSASWIVVTSVQNPSGFEDRLSDLDHGEAETVMLACELGADWTLMDERKGRRRLAEYGLAHIGTIGILLKARHLGLISSLRPELDHLEAHGFRLSADLRKRTLRQAD